MSVPADQRRPAGAAKVGPAKLGELRMRLEGGAVIDAVHLAEIPGLAELRDPRKRAVVEKQLGKYRGAVVRRQFRAGQVLCWQGDPGSTAFYLEAGQLEILIGPRAKAETTARRDRGTLRGLLRRARQKLFRRPAVPDGPVIPGPRFLTDGPVDLDPRTQSVATVGPGELVGEMACMSFLPRSATIRAATDCSVLEMLGVVLNILRKNLPGFKAQLDEAFRRRALDGHLRSMPLFASLDDAAFARLVAEAELVEYKPEELIFRAGDPSDSLYLVRQGFVKVSQPWPGSEMILRYLPRGSYFGETAVLDDESAVRTTTCTAFTHSLHGRARADESDLESVQLVRIRRPLLRELSTQFPPMGKFLRRLTRVRHHEDAHRPEMTPGADMHQFIERGLMEAQNLLILDLDKCTRCDECARACVASHDGISRLYRQGLRFDHYLVPTSCRSCADPVCMLPCPVGSIFRGETGAIEIADWCIGCGNCAEACPYGAIGMHQVPGRVVDRGTTRVAVPIAKTCDLCSAYGEPNCVYACPHDAAHRVDPLVFFGDQLAGTWSRAGE